MVVGSPCKRDVAGSNPVSGSKVNIHFDCGGIVKTTQAVREIIRNVKELLSLTLWKVIATGVAPCLENKWYQR